MKPKKIEIRSSDIEDLIEPDEIEFQFNQKMKVAPDIIREIAHFLETVADYYDHKRKEE